MCKSQKREGNVASLCKVGSSFIASNPYEDWLHVLGAVNGRRKHSLQAHVRLLLPVGASNAPEPSAQPFLLVLAAPGQVYLLFKFLHDAAEEAVTGGL